MNFPIKCDSVVQNRVTLQNIFITFIWCCKIPFSWLFTYSNANYHWTLSSNWVVHMMKNIQKLWMIERALTITFDNIITSMCWQILEITYTFTQFSHSWKHIFQLNCVCYISDKLFNPTVLYSMESIQRTLLVMIHKKNMRIKFI